MTFRDAQQTVHATEFFDVTLTLDTLIYAAGDVLSDTVAITNVARVPGGRFELRTLLLTDEDDQGVAIDVYFFDSNVSLGTKNVAPNISDANARTQLGRVQIATGDYQDLGGVRTAVKTGIGLLMECPNGSRDIYLSTITVGGTPTYTVNGLKLRLGFVQY